MNAQSDSPENWEQIRIAYHVARLGTLSAAAAHLGIHHATVIRQINALEARLGNKLFQRHTRGYTPTEAGHDLMRVAGGAEDQFTQMAGRLKGQGSEVSGPLIVTTLNYLSPQITPLLVAFQREYPDVQITLEAGDRRLRLEYGEAHVALRAGPKPSEPDNVVQPLNRVSHALFAHKRYIAKYGRLEDEEDIANHRFVGSSLSSARGPVHVWARKHIPDAAIVYRSTERGMDDAVHEGAGIGFLSLWSGRTNPDLVQMMPPRQEWDTVLWLVTHIDLHRTPKVQALLAFMKEKAGELQQHGR